MLHMLTRPTQDYKFILDNDNPPLPDRARERYVGLTNRVIGGMLIHQVRVYGLAHLISLPHYAVCSLHAQH